MKRAVIALVLTLAGTLMVRAQQRPAFNGSFWKGLPDAMKSSYVKGFIDGVYAASEYLARGSSMAQETIRAMDSGKEKVDQKIYSDMQSQYVEFSIASAMLTEDISRKNGNSPTIAEIKSGVDTFYSVPENLPVCAGDAVMIETASLVGKPYGDDILRGIRQKDGQNGCE